MINEERQNMSTLGKNKCFVPTGFFEGVASNPLYIFVNINPIKAKLSKNKQYYMS